MKRIAESQAYRIVSAKIPGPGYSWFTEEQQGGRGACSGAKGRLSRDERDPGGQGVQGLLGYSLKGFG